MNKIFAPKTQKRDFDQKQNYQKIVKKMNFDNFWWENSKSNRKSMYKNHNKSLIFGSKIQIHNYIIVLKINFLDRICDFLRVCMQNSNGDRCSNSKVV